MKKILKHLVVVTGWYYPAPSPTGYCIAQIIKHLKGKFRISVICYDQTSRVNGSFKQIDGVDLYFLSNFRLRLRALSLERLALGNRSSLASCSYKCTLALSRMLRAFTSIWAWPTSESWYMNKAWDLLREIDSHNQVDVLITVSNPFEAHMCGLKFKLYRPDVTWISYSLDHFTNAHAHHRYFFSKKLKNKLNVHFERRVFETADFNFVTHELQPWYYEITKDMSHKMQAISFPLLDFPDKEAGPCVLSRYKGKINLVYAGTLYKRIRNPEYLLRLIANLNNEDIVLHLFVQGDCMEIINRYVRGSNGRIVVHGMVSKNEMQSIMQQANILVNLGNSIYEQKPSKLYEYASTGKPIVNVHYQGIEYREFFDRYKLSLNINQTAGNLHNDVINLQRFCVKNANNVLSNAEILESFEDSTPSYIAGIFEHRIKILVESQALEHA